MTTSPLATSPETGAALGGNGMSDNETESQWRLIPVPASYTTEWRCVTHRTTWMKPDAWAAHLAEQHAEASKDTAE